MKDAIPRNLAASMSTPEAGPSRVGLSLAPPARIASPSRDEFAERFKYLVASSGLLEKTQLASLGSALAASDVTHASHDSPTSHHRAPLAPADADAGSVLSGELRRWDIIGALAVIVAGLIYILGPSASIVPGAVFTTGAALYWQKLVSAPALVRLLTTKSQSQKRERPASSDPHGRGEDAIKKADEDAIPPERPGEVSTGRARVMRGLEGLLDESKALDQSILAALQILGPRPDDTEHAHELRIALHRLFEDMTDGLATATSSLTAMCDRAELAVLGDMYGMQLTGGQRRRRASITDDEDVSPSSAHKHTRPRASSSGATSSPALYRAPMMLSPLGRTPIRALAPSALDANDRFTKLPNRASPRFNRTSWTTDWNARPRMSRIESEVRSDGEEGSDSVLSATSTESSSMPASLPDDRSITGALSPPLMANGAPFTPKRASPLVQTLARLEMPEWSRQPPTPPFPVLSSKRPSQSPFRRSLHEIPYIPSPPVSSHEKAQSLAVARATTSMSSDKRRSLQTPFNPGTPVLDYTRQDVVLAASANLTRARSLPHSDKARDESGASSQRTSPASNTARPESPGLKRLSLLSDRRPSPPSSKGTSLLFPDAMSREASSLGYGRAPFRAGLMSRVPSVSPLTLGGLRASCLGVHLKRRRMVCCLLGLRFREDEESGYWDEVDLVLRGLTDMMSEALARLEVLRADAEREDAAMQAIMAAASHAFPPTPSPPRSIPSLLRTGGDFAPRDSVEQALRTSMDDLQRLLARVWARTDEVRALAANGESDFGVLWAEMRNDIGNMLRHVDRNRLRLEVDEDEREREETPVPKLPDFARAWNPEPGPGPEEIERLVEDEDNVDTSHDLPPPGTDQVFEATIPAGVEARQRSVLSREERIQLSKEARARGMTMAQLEGSKDPSRAAEIQRQLEAEHLRAVSGEMVQELQGMFGAIRRRKGMDEA